MRHNHERMREMRRIARDAMRDFPEMVRRGGPKSPWSRPFCAHVEQDAAGLLQHLGGEASEVELALVRDAAIVGASLEVVAAYFVQSGGDLEAASRISSLASAHAKLLSMLGLARRAKQLPSLSQYLQDRAVEQPLSNQPENPEPDREAARDPHAGHLRVEPEDAALVEPGDVVDQDWPGGAGGPVEGPISNPPVLKGLQAASAPPAGQERGQACTPDHPRTVDLHGLGQQDDAEPTAPAKRRP